MDTSKNTGRKRHKYNNNNNNNNNNNGHFESVSVIQRCPLCGGYFIQ